MSGVVGSIAGSLVSGFISRKGTKEAQSAVRRGAATARDESGRALSEISAGESNALRNLFAGRDHALAEFNVGRDAALANLFGGRDAAVSALRNFAIPAARASFDAQADILDPFIDAGDAAIEELKVLTAENGDLVRGFNLNDFEADPGFAFRKAEGQEALTNRLAAMGLRDSGNALRAGIEFNQGLATEEFDRAFNRFQTTQGNRFNRLAHLATVGQRTREALASARAELGAREFQANVGVGNLFASTGEAAARAVQRKGELAGDAFTRTGERVGNTAFSAGTGRARALLDNAGIQARLAASNAGLAQGGADRLATIASGGIASAVDEFNFNRFLESQRQPVPTTGGGGVL